MIIIVLKLLPQVGVIIDQVKVSAELGPRIPFLNKLGLHALTQGPSPRPRPLQERPSSADFQGCLRKMKLSPAVALSLSCRDTLTDSLVTLELTSNKISMTSAVFRPTFHFEFKVFCYKPTETVQFNIASLMLNEPFLAVSTYIRAI